MSRIHNERKFDPNSKLTVQSGLVRVLKRQAGILQSAERRMTLSLVIVVRKLRELGSI